MIEYDEIILAVSLYFLCYYIGRNVTILRGCRQSAMVSAVSSGGNQVGISVSSQSCSTDLCNTGNGLIGPNNNLLPGFNISNSNINFGFINNHFDFFNHFKKVLNQTFSRQSPSVVSEAKRMILKDLNEPTSLKMFGVIIPQVYNDANYCSNNINRRLLLFCSGYSTFDHYP